MSSPIFEFLVKEVINEQPEQLHVLGRNGDLPIRIGDRFDRIYCFHPRKHPEESGRKPVRNLEKIVTLRVVAIDAYQRSLPELGEGSTGGLVIDGEGLELVIPGWLLGTDEEEPSRNGHAANPVERTVSV